MSGLSSSPVCATGSDLDHTLSACLRAISLQHQIEECLERCGIRQSPLYCRERCIKFLFCPNLGLSDADNLRVSVFIGILSVIFSGACFIAQRIEEIVEDLKRKSCVATELTQRLQILRVQPGDQCTGFQAGNEQSARFLLVQRFE